MLAMVTGLREGELLGLRWSDVDLDAGTVTVRGSMQPDERGRRVIDETKTRSSRRLVVLPRLTAAALVRHRSVQARERLRAGPRWEALGLVFPNTVADRSCRRTCCSVPCIRCWSGLGCRGCASMTFATARRRCCWPGGCTRRW